MDLYALNPASPKFYSGWDDVKQLSDPAWVDEIMHSDHKKTYIASILSLKGQDSLLVYRQAHAWLKSLAYDKALECLKTLPEPHKGLELLCMVGLQLYSHVLTESLEGKALSPLAMEDRLYGEYALAIAHSESNHLEASLAHLERAEVLACCLGMQGQQQALRIERARQLLLLGRPDPSILAAEVVQPGPRAAWHAEIWVISLMAQGSYRKALALSQEKNLNDLAALANALHLSNYQAAKCALEKLRTMGNPDETVPLGEPFASYEKLFSAAVYMQQGQDNLAISVLGETPPARPDQAVLHSILCLGLKTKHDLGHLEANIAKLENPTEVLSLAKALCPVGTLVAGFADVHPSLSALVQSTPIVRNRHISFKDKQLSLPKQVPTALFHDALYNNGAFNSLHREVKRRYRLKLKELGTLQEDVVHIADIWKALNELEDSGYNRQYWQGIKQDIAKQDKQLGTHTTHT